MFGFPPARSRAIRRDTRNTVGLLEQLQQAVSSLPSLHRRNPNRVLSTILTLQVRLLGEQHNAGQRMQAIASQPWLWMKLTMNRLIWFLSTCSGDRQRSLVGVSAAP